jgi:D-serine deaminase-like pyridoxal phosphate-dependent protein
MIGRPRTALDTPALLVDVPAMERNVARMARTIVQEAGVRWRPHIKGIKSPALAHLLLRAGASGVTCAKVSEAEVMAGAGIGDVLIANQVVGAAKVRRLVALQRYARVIAAVDCQPNIVELDAAAQASGTVQPVVIEVNVGMNRAGVDPGEPVLRLAQEIVGRPGLRFLGVMAWESHALRTPDEATKRRAVRDAIASLAESAARCRAAGLDVEIVSCGGTGTYWISAFEPGVTEIQAGGGVLGDLNYRETYGVPATHECALTLLATVTSRPTPSRIICDAGMKAMSDGRIAPRPLGVPDVAALALSAEHGKITLTAAHDRPRVGETIEFVIGHGDSTVVLHDELWGIRDGLVETRWPLLARGCLQ